MKRTILAAALAAVPMAGLAAEYEITLQQRNASNTAWLMRIPVNPPGTNNGMFWIDGTTKVLKWVTPVGATYDQFANTLTFNGTQADWNSVSGPASILNKPTIPAAQVQTDWNAVSGMGVLLNKPVIPAAQVPSDWLASSGPSQILNKPSIPAAQVNADWSANSGLAQILNRPTLATVAVSGAYADLSGKPMIPAAQVNTDWNSVSGVSQLLNKPSLAAVAISGAYADLTGKPSIPAAQVNADWAAGSGVSQILNKPALFDGTWGSLTGKPSTFTPSAHVHDSADIVSGTLADARIPSLAISKTTGLQAALDAKFPTPAGTTAQYVRGNGTLATLPTAMPFSFGAPTTRTVALATAYQCTSNTLPCIFTITLTSTSSISLSGTSNNEGQIVLGATNAVASGTGTVFGTYRNVLGGGLVVGLNLTSAQANTYTVPVPAGWYLAVRQTVGTGLTVVSAFDQQSN